MANAFETSYGKWFTQPVDFCVTSEMLMRSPGLLAFIALSGVVGIVARAESPTSRTIGTRRVLVIRADFSDLVGASITASDMQAVMDNQVRPFYEENSYGAVTLTSTVTSQVYRLPQTGSSYALAGDSTALHADARALAGSDYNLSNYDRIIVTFPDLGHNHIPGSLIDYAGLAITGGDYVWINSTPTWDYVAHELGHTFGLAHANLWLASDGIPVSANGQSVDGGDHYDLMGSPASNALRADPRRHFNQRFKNQLGWLPDRAVTTVTESGIYRLYRFDHKDSLLRNQPLALRIFRDGARWYWLGYRRQFATSGGSPQANGASVLWGFNADNRETQTIDLGTSGSNIFDSTLAVGGAFYDSDYGLTVRVVGSGGSDPSQYIDIEILVPPSSTPKSSVLSWGGVFAESKIPSGLSDVVAMSTGDTHAIALRADGTVIAWGDNSNGQTTIPSDAAGDVVAVAAGGNMTGVIKRDGSVRLWGEGLSGVTAPPSGLTGVKQLVIGGSRASFYRMFHALALKNDGTVVAWGDNSQGQINVPAGLANVVSVAAPNLQSIALRSDGTLVHWGVTWAGSTAAPTGNIAAIASYPSAGNTLALKLDGTVTAWGVGQGTIPVGLGNVVAIACGQNHWLALQADGSVSAWGDNVAGQTKIPPGMPRAFAVAASAAASYALIGSRISITAQPQSQAVSVGQNVALSVSASGTGAFAYQWRKNGVFISGATSRTLTLGSFATGDAGTYDVIVKGPNGFAPTLSAPAIVGIAPTPGRLINLSVLTQMAPGETMTIGTVLGGSGTSGGKPILVRAAGPALAQFGISNGLPNPTIALTNTSTNPPTNTGVSYGWSGTSTLVASFASVGAFPFLSETSKDSAMFERDLPASNYTLQVRDAGNGSGPVIAELYDASRSDTFTTVTPRLINISAMKVIDIGSSLTAGFVVGGASSVKVLMRAVGPTLAAPPFNIVGTMPNPKLELFNNHTGIKVNENAGWGGRADLTATFTAVGAFQFISPNSSDSALLVELPPDQYSVRVGDANGGRGAVIVEIFEVP